MDDIKVNIDLLYKLYKHKTDEVDTVLNYIKRYIQAGVKLLSIVFEEDSTNEDFEEATRLKGKYLRKAVYGLLHLNSEAKKIFKEEFISGYIPLKDVPLCQHLVGVFIDKIYEMVKKEVNTKQT